MKLHKLRVGVSEGVVVPPIVVLVDADPPVVVAVIGGGQAVGGHLLHVSGGENLHGNPDLLGPFKIYQINLPFLN